MQLPRIDLTRHDNEGSRYYVTPIGKVPSVTSILGATKDKSFLKRWKMKVGAVEAERIRTEASARGNDLHAQLEGYFMHGVKGSGPWWDSVWPFLQEITDVHLVEGPLWHPIGFAGTTDMLADWKNIASCIDWKSARSKRKKAWVKDYILQTTAYAGAANYHYRDHGFNAKRGIVVVALEDQPAQIFHITHTQLKKSWPEFGVRIREYHATMREFTDDLFSVSTPAQKAAVVTQVK